MMKYQQNYAAINNVLTTIKNVASTSYLNEVNTFQWIAYEYNASMVKNLDNSGKFSNSSKTNSNKVRPVFITGLSSN